MDNSSELIEKAVTEAKSGNKNGAKQILAQVVRQEPGNAHAWYLLSCLFEDKQQIIYCLNKVLEINPDNPRAQARLNNLQQQSKPAQSKRTQSIKQRREERVIVIALLGLLGLCIILFSACYGLNALGLFPQSFFEDYLPQPVIITDSFILPTVPVTQIPVILSTNTISPTITPEPMFTQPIQTERPSTTPTEMPPVKSGESLDTIKYISKNYLGSAESNGVIVELARVIIGEKETLAKEKDIAYLTDPDHNISNVVKDSAIVVEVIFKITNNTDNIRNIKLRNDKAVFILNGEQIPLQEYLDYANLQESFIDGFIDPRTSVHGGFWLPTSLLSVNEAKSIALGLPPARDQGNHRVTDRFLITVDIVDWGWEDIPQEFEQ